MGYGYAIDEKLKLYCGKNEFIKIGTQIEFNGVRYMIESLFEDDLGSSAIMARIGCLREEKTSA